MLMIVVGLVLRSLLWGCKVLEHLEGVAKLGMRCTNSGDK